MCVAIAMCTARAKARAHENYLILHLSCDPHRMYSVTPNVWQNDSSTTKYTKNNLSCISRFLLREEPTRKKLPLIAMAMTILAALAMVAPGQVTPVDPNGRHIGANKLYYGAAYYPEHWPASEIDRDIARMKDLRMNVMRVAEFAWSRMEPREGEYDFAWLHGAIDKLHAGGIDVVLGTPTATPPAWLVEKYPDVMRVNQDGSRQTHGARRDCSYSSATYRRLCRRIVERMAQEFGNRPGVIGWQTDNEFLLTPDYSDETIRTWRAWLKERYGTIEELNRRWGTELWSQTYNSFDQVPAPVDRINHHPSLRFNWLRFTNEQIAEFQAEQIAAIRKYSKLPIAHDTMANQPVNYELLNADLDYMGFNTYHDYEFYWRIAGNYDRMRGFGKGMHWLFETAPNYAGGSTTRFIHSPVGGVRAALWMNHALGGQASLFWLWRQHRTGQEMTHGSVISAWGKPAANYDALRQIGEEIERTSDFLMRAPVAPAQVAILYSNESAAGLEIEPYISGLQYYFDWSARFYRPLQDAYLHRDVIMPGNNLSGYRMVFVPLLPCIPAATRARMKSWVEAGGTLVLGPMSGYRDEEWTAFTDHALGDIETWSGIEVDARLPIGGTPKLPVPVKLRWSDAGVNYESPADLWQETLSSKSGRVLATYGNGLADSKPAIIEARTGKGKVVILGTDPGPEALGKLLLRLAGEAGIKPMAQGEAGVIVSPRAAGNSSGWVVVNVTGTPKKITLESGGVDLLSGREKTRSLALAPYDVVILRSSGSR